MAEDEKKVVDIGGEELEQETLEVENVLDEDATMEERVRAKMEAEEAEVEEVPEFIAFEVRTPSGKKFMFHDIDPETTIGEVKRLIEKRDDSYSFNSIKFIKTGKVLADSSQTLEEVGVAEGSVIHMVKKLGGAVNSNNPGFELKKTDAQDRGFITIRIPANARAGTKLILNPPGRSERLYVTVPAGYRAGDTLRVRLPEERNEAGQSMGSQRPTRTNAERSTRMQGGGNTSDLMKVLCPPNAVPGSDIQIEVPGKGRMKVKVPNTVRPGEYFYFRVMAT